METCILDQNVTYILFSNTPSTLYIDIILLTNSSLLTTSILHPIQNN